MSIRESRPESITIHFVKGWKDAAQTFDDVRSVEWHEHIIRICRKNNNAVTYPYRELRMIEEFDDDPSVCK